MGFFTYIAAICLALECLASGLSSLHVYDPNMQTSRLNNQLQSKAVDTSSIRLTSREAQPMHRLENPRRGSNASKNPIMPLLRLNSAPPRMIQPSSTGSKDSLHRLPSAPEALSLPLNRSSGESRQATPTKVQNEATQTSMIPAVKQIERGDKQIDSQASTSKPPITVQLAKTARSKGQTYVRTKSAEIDGGSSALSPPSSSRPGSSNARSDPRIAHDSGARSSGRTMGNKSPKSATIGMNAQEQARLIEHNQWLVETKEAIQRAESASAKMPKARKRLQHNPTPRMIEAAILANKAKTGSKEARIIAKDAISKADEVLRLEPASSSKASTCVSITDQKARTACAVGAVHAKMERKAAIVASEDRRWDFTAKHTKVSAIAMTRARAFEAQNNAFVAQYAAKVNDEKVKSLSPDNSHRKKAEQNAQSSHADYRDKALFYKSVHGQYRQTRQDLKGSESEDEERIFPDIS